MAKKRAEKFNLCIFVTFSRSDFNVFEKNFDDSFCGGGFGGLW